MHRRSREEAPQRVAPLPSPARVGTAEAALLLERISALLDEHEQRDA